MRVDRAVVLAAGLGTRLRWLTRERPKALMPVGKAPAIEWVIRRLAASGVHDVVLNLHHRGGLIEETLGDGARLGVRIRYSREKRLLDSGGGVRKAMELLPGDGPFVVHNADILSDLDLQALASHCPPGGACLGLVANPAHHPDGDFALRDGLVRADGGPRLTYAGISVWHPAALVRWRVGEAFPLSDAMRALIGEGRCAGLVHRGWWFDIGRPADWLRARRFDAFRG